MIKLKAINPKHQSMVNRCIAQLCKYHEYNRERGLAYDEFLSEQADAFDFLQARKLDSMASGEDFDDSVAKAYRKADKKCISSFDKYLEYRSELPKREVANIESSEYY